MLTAFKSQSQQHLKPTFEGLSNRYVTAFNQDNNGLIWIGTTNGLNRFDGNSFKQFFANTPELNLVNSTITCFLNLDENVFLIGTKGGINKVHFFLNDKYKVEVISDKEVTTLIRYSKNEFLAGTSNGELILFDSSFHSHTIYKDKQMASVKNICTDSKNNIWFGKSPNSKDLILVEQFDNIESYEIYVFTEHWKYRFLILGLIQANTKIDCIYNKLN